MKVGDFVAKNEKNLVKLNRLGYVNSSVILQFKIYQDFNRLKTSIPVMQRYSELSEKYRVSEKTIRNAVARMKKII